MRNLVVFPVVTMLLALVGTPLQAQMPERMGERVAACAACHGEQGRSRQDAYYPSIAGKPEAYLFNQLRHFRDGHREHRVMSELLAALSDDYLRQMARYYAAQQPRKATPTQAAILTPAQAAMAEQLVEQGDAQRGLPACRDCHGRSLHGVLPAVPGLTGLDAEYITAQLGAWQAGVRSAGVVDCMADIARRMSAQQITAVAGWLASQPVSAENKPEPPGESALPLRCFPPAPTTEQTAAASEEDAQVQRGEYLVRAGNCVGCHSVPGAAKLAGGRPIETPFGAVYSSNLTPDQKTGLGSWDAEDFWRALNRGIAADGRLLYPAFPYTHYQLIRRRDSDAMWAYLRSLPAVARARPPHQLRFPFNTQLALRVWRWLYFKPAELEPQPQRDQAWHRGRYLVEGLGHCSACHGQRNAMGALQTERSFAGSLLPDKTWYAPPLARERSAAERAALPALLKRGSAAHRVASGPMAEVVKDSLQYLRDADIEAMVAYLDSLPAAEPTPVSSLRVTPALKQRQMMRGADLYARHCADCHGRDGQGEAEVFPALRGNPAVLAASPGNAIRSLKFGGYGASTQGNPYPYGMPPFAHQLDADEMAAVLTYVRNAWGHQASAVSPVEVAR